MCGIAGILNLNYLPVYLAQLKRMTDIIAHRGPDGEGHYINGHCGLGHRRLAILDLSSAGHQPMQTSDGRYVLTYNGEIYNFLELKRQLELLGYCFNSRTDTEVVLKGFSEWGISLFSRLNGMFAFAIWDKQERKLILARDRYGIKPLYYGLQNGSFIFASEVKAIIASGLYKTELDKEALLEYLTFQNFFSNKTLFKHVNLVPPGSYVEINPRKNIAIKRYWDFDFATRHHIEEREALEELDRLFTQAVNRQLISDVPINSYLSGGIDSSTITILASRQLSNLKSFTIGFDLNSASGLELAYDERSKAELISYFAKTEHYQMVLKAGDMERCMQNLVWHLEEPRAGQCYPNFYAAKLASKFGKVVLSGTGGDELFGGYPWRYFQSNGSLNFDDYIDKYYLYWQRLVPNAYLKKLLSPIWGEVDHIWTRDIFKNVFPHFPDKLNSMNDYVNHSLYFELKTFLPSLLILDDKLSMAYGLETRVPFLDNDLVDFSTKLPWIHKLDPEFQSINLNENNIFEKGLRKSQDGKRIFRKLSEKYLPNQFSTFPKQGFSAPDASWFRGESLEYVKNSLFNKNASIYNYVDYDFTISVVNEHIHGNNNRRLLIWSLLYLEEFFNTFFAGSHVKKQTEKVKEQEKILEFS